MRVNGSWPRSTLLAMTLALTAGCEDSTAPVPLAALTLTESLEMLALGGGAGDPFAYSMSGIPAVAAADHPACALDTDRFVCPDVEVDGLTISRSFQLLDTLDAPLAGWSDEVFAVRQVVDVAGTREFLIPDASRTEELTAHDESLLRGIRTGERRLTGLATATRVITSYSIAGTATTFTVESSRTTDLLFGPPGSHPRGTIEVEGRNIDMPVFSASATITFDGTRIVQIEIVGSGGLTSHCTMDLRRPELPAVCV